MRTHGISGGTGQTQRTASRRFRRTPANTAETERRSEWGKTWGAVGAAYKAARLAAEGS